MDTVGMRPGIYIWIPLRPWRYALPGAGRHQDQRPPRFSDGVGATAHLRGCPAHTDHPPCSRLGKRWWSRLAAAERKTPLAFLHQWGLEDKRSPSTAFCVMTVHVPGCRTL